MTKKWRLFLARVVFAAITLLVFAQGCEQSSEGGPYAEAIEKSRTHVSRLQEVWRCRDRPGRPSAAWPHGAGLLLIRIR